MFFKLPRHGNVFEFRHPHGPCGKVFLG